jgi:phosphoglycolate phosphatase
MGDLRRLVAFDLDGTLVDSRRDLALSVNQLIAELGGGGLSEQAVGRMIGEGAGVLVQRALLAAGLGGRPGALVRFLEIYDTRLLDNTRAYEGVVQAIHAARRHAHVAVVTNKPRLAAERILAGLDLREVIDEVVGGDGPFPRKPDPGSLLDLMARVGSEAGTTLLVGDSAVDHETARRAATRCCVAAYGFGYETLPTERLIGSEWIAGTPSALVHIIEQFAAGGGA